MDIDIHPIYSYQTLGIDSYVKHAFLIQSKYTGQAIGHLDRARVEVCSGKEPNLWKHMSCLVHRKFEIFTVWNIFQIFLFLWYSNQLGYFYILGGVWKRMASLVLRRSSRSRGLSRAPQTFCTITPQHGFFWCMPPLRSCPATGRQCQVFTEASKQGQTLPTRILSFGVSWHGPMLSSTCRTSSLLFKVLLGEFAAANHEILIQYWSFCDLYLLIFGRPASFLMHW